MPQPLETLLAEFVKITSRSRQRERENVLHDKKLIPRDVEIVGILFHHHPEKMTFKEIVDELDLGSGKTTNRSTISQAITRLMKDHKLVEKIIDVDGDQRQPIITLTPSGFDLAKALDDVDRSLIPKFIDAMNLDGNSREQLVQILERGITNFKKLSSVVLQDFQQQKPNVARIYDYLIGGKHNFAVDRQMGEMALKKNPLARETAKANRAFLRRSLRYLAEEKGIKQFVDIGSGLPTTGNTHEIVQGIDPEAKVVYVDYDKDAVTASKVILDQNPNARAFCADLSNPLSILNAPEMKLIDFAEPVALVMVLVLHFIVSDEQALQAIKALKERLAKGSFLVISHGSHPPEMDTSKIDELVKQYSKAVTPVKMRSKREIQAFFQDARLISPGLVYPPQWRPEIPDSFLPEEQALLRDQPFRSLVLAGVAEC